MINTILLYRNTIFIVVLLFFCSYKNLYSQNYPAKPTFSEFMNRYSIYDEYIKNDIEFLSKTTVIQELWDKTYKYIEGLGSSNWLAIMKDPNKIYRYTDNNDVAFLLGASSGLAYLYEGNVDKMSTLMDKLKRKINMSAASGDNYRIIIPMHYPLGTIGLSTYVNFQLPDKNNNLEGIGYWNDMINALDHIPIPYIQLSTQINCWTAPMSLGLRFAFAPGFKDLYKPFISDIEVDSIAYHAGLDIKFFIYRDNYFFVDARTDFNFDMGEINLNVRNKEFFFEVPIENASDSGVVFDSSTYLGGKWTSFALTPKIVGGFKFKEKVPYIDYFAIYGMLGVDLIYSFYQGAYDINVGDMRLISPNNRDNSYVLKTSYVDKAESLGQYFAYDIRVGLNIDIFYQSLSIEYAFFSKSFSIMFMPFVYRFGPEPKI